MSQEHNEEMQDQSINEESMEYSGDELTDMERVEKERDDFRDQLLRKSAEFENYRRRTMKEKQDLIDFANEHLIIKIFAYGIGSGQKIYGSRGLFERN